MTSPKRSKKSTKSTSSEGEKPEVKRRRAAKRKSAEPPIAAEPALAAVESAQGPRQLFPRLHPVTRQWLRGFGLVALFLLALWMAYQLKAVFTPLLIAAAIAYILNPLVTRLEARGIPRVRSTLYVYAIASVAVGGLLFYLFLVLTRPEADPGRPPQTASAEVSGNRPIDAAMTTQSTQPSDKTAEESAWLATLKRVASAAGVEVGPEQLRDFVKPKLAAIIEKAYGIGARVFTSVLDIISIAILVPLFSFFLLLRFNDITGTIGRYLPREYRDQIISIVKQIDQATADFFRGQLLVCSAVGLLLGIGWTIIGVRMGMVAGIAVGVLNLVPFLSWIFGLPLCILFCWLAPGGITVGLVLKAVGWYLFVQTMESVVLTPTIQGKSVGLHPISTVLALLIGSEVAGIFGMMLAIPAACAAKILFKELVLPQLQEVAEVDST